MITYTWGCEWNSRAPTLTTNPLLDKENSGIRGYHQTIRSFPAWENQMVPPAKAAKIKNKGWLFVSLWRKGLCLVYWQENYVAILGKSLNAKNMPNLCQRCCDNKLGDKSSISRSMVLYDDMCGLSMDYTPLPNDVMCVLLWLCF